MRGVRAPTLVMTGERSLAGVDLLMDILEELLPNVERLKISDASHDMHLDNPLAVNEAILGFLGRQSDRPMAPASP